MSAQFQVVTLFLTTTATVVSIATTYSTDPEIVVRFPTAQKMFLLSKAFRPSLPPSRPPVQWVPGAFSRVKETES
jgi:hypothetical protein